ADPLTLKSGEKVTSPQIWWEKRRAEIVEDFDREVYGRVPKDVPAVKWEVTKTTKEKVGEVPVITKQLAGHVDNSSYPYINVDIQLTLSTPEKSEGPVPVTTEPGFILGAGGSGRGPATRTGVATTVSATRPAFAGFGRAASRGPTWPQQ